MAEIPFEVLLAAHEASRGTAITPPTHLLHMGGTVKPLKATYRTTDKRGTLAKNSRGSTVVRRGDEWSAEGDADTGILPFLLNTAVVGGVIAPTTPVGATNARLWEFVRALTADNLRSMTLYFGDPNVQVWQADYCMTNELSFANNAGDESVLTLSASGQGGRPVAVAAPTVPAAIAGPLLPGQLMELWIDTSSAIGTTPVTGRLLSAEHTVPTGVTYKHLASGPTANMDFAATGREQVAPTTKLVFELFDLTQYNQWEQHTALKVRVRHNGPLIEVGFYHYVEFDIYGTFDMFDWGENQGSNRTIQLEIEGDVDSTLGSDLAVRVQSTRTAL